MSEIITTTPDTPEETGAGDRQNEHKFPKWWHPRWWLGIGVCLLIIFTLALFIACRYWLGWPYDTPAFVSGVIGLLTLSAILVQLFVNRMQWHAMQETLAHSKTAFSLGERAYIGIRECHLLQPLAIGVFPCVNATFLNGGKTPAWNFFAAFRVIIEVLPPREIPDRYKVQITDNVEDLRGSFLPAGAEKVVDFIQAEASIENAATLTGIQNGLAYLYIIGMAHYKDFQGESQTFPFYMVYDPDDGGLTDIL